MNRSNDAGIDQLPVLILAHPWDQLAQRVCLVLRKSFGSAAVRIASDEELAFASEVTLRLDDGVVDARIAFGDGMNVAADGIGAVFNRLRDVDARHFGNFRADDRSYAVSETHALWLALLAGLPCPVVNRATPRGLCGPMLENSEWLFRASRAGLPTRGWELTTDPRRCPTTESNIRQLSGIASATPALPGRGLTIAFEPLEDVARITTVVGDRVCGALSAEWRKELTGLACAAGCKLLEVHWKLRVGGDPSLANDWRVFHVSAFPEQTDEPVVHAICEELWQSAQPVVSG